MEVGADAILVSPGMLQASAELLAGTRISIIVPLDWTNKWRASNLLGFQEGRMCAVAGVKDAIRWDADAVLTYVFMGLNDAAVEVEEVRRNAEVNRPCERPGMVHVIESMACGARVNSPSRKEFVTLHTRMAEESGADLTKRDFLNPRPKPLKLSQRASSRSCSLGG